MNPYDILKVKKDATPEEIKKSFYNLSKKYHPDKPGGDREKMNAITEAYTILKDPLKRQYYDQTGEAPKSDQMALGLACQILISIIDSNPSDIQGHLKNLKINMEMSYDQQIQERLNNIEKFEKFEERIKQRPDNDFIGITIQNEINTLNIGIETLKKDREQHIEAFKKFAGYQFNNQEEEFKLNFNVNTAY